MQERVQHKVSDFFDGYPARTLHKGHILVFAGEEPSGVYFIESGQIGQYDVSKKGQQMMVNVFKPPAFFPMSWAINGTPNQYLYEALEASTVRRAPAADVIDFLKREPEVLLDLLARVYRGTDGLLKRMSLLMEGDAYARLLFELLISAARYGEPGSAGIVVHLKESDLASRSGLARETVSRNLTRLKDKGLIRTKAGSITMPDMEALQAELDARTA